MYDSMKIQINRKTTYKVFNGYFKAYLMLLRLTNQRIKWLGYRNDLNGNITIYNLITQNNNKRHKKRKI